MTGPLLASALRGDILTLKFGLVSVAANEINRPGPNGFTLLHAAAGKGHANCVRLLLEAGASVDQVTTGGYTPLFGAAHCGQAECVRALCAAGAKVNLAADDGRTPLHQAAEQGHTDCILALIKAGAPVDQETVFGNNVITPTPLWRAACRGHIECVRVLCDAGAAVNKATHRWTPLRVAALEGHIECAHLLSSYGARDACAAGHAAERGIIDLAAWLRRAQAWTPLHHLEVLTPARALALLRDGADLYAGAPSPLERAKTTPGEASALVVLAGERWSPQTHHLFPAASRAYAVEVMRLGYLLAWSTRYVGEASAMVDVWMGYVLPHVVTRQVLSKPPEHI